MTDNQLFLVSIIIPVYNVENYIAECIESVLKQTYKMCEIILIDDGSTDNSGKICDLYKNRNRRISVYHKENGGLSDARNYGITKSRGDYLAFIDSDDIIAENYVETLLNLLIEYNADASCVDCYYTKQRNFEKVESVKEIRGSVTGIEAIKKCMIRDGFGTSAWGKLYKRKLFDSIKFPVGKLYEDIQTIPYIFENCQMVAYSNKKLYLWFHRDESIMHRRIRNEDLEVFAFLDTNIKYMDHNCSQLHDAMVCRYCVDSFKTIIQRLTQEKNYLRLTKQISQYSRSYWSEGVFNKYVPKSIKVQLILILINPQLYKVVYKGIRIIKRKG